MSCSHKSYALEERIDQSGSVQMVMQVRSRQQNMEELGAIHCPGHGNSRDFDYSQERANECFGKELDQSL